jgi:hypothetical protein
MLRVSTISLAVVDRCTIALKLVQVFNHFIQRLGQMLIVVSLTVIERLLVLVVSNAQTSDKGL